MANLYAFAKAPRRADMTVVYDLDLLMSRVDDKVLTRFGNLIIDKWYSVVENDLEPIADYTDTVIDLDAPTDKDVLKYVTDEVDTLPRENSSVLNREILTTMFRNMVEAVVISSDKGNLDVSMEMIGTDIFLVCGGPENSYKNLLPSKNYDRVRLLNTLGIYDKVFTVEEIVEFNMAQSAKHASMTVLYCANDDTVTGYDPENIYVVNMNELAKHLGSNINAFDANDMLLEEDSDATHGATIVGTPLSDLLKTPQESE